MGLFGKKTRSAGPETTILQAPAAKSATAAEEAAADSELIAVIMAAVSAYESEQYKQTLYIRKINRVAGVRPAWGAMGTQEAIDTRRM